MKKMKLTASSLRVILASSIFIIIGLAAAGFYFGQNQLTAFADTVGQTTANAEASNDNVSALQTLKTNLDKQKNAAQKAASIVADSQSYQYQNQIVEDLSIYASKANIRITEFNFQSSASTATGAAGATATTSPTPTQLPGGLRSVTVTVTIQNPVNYNNLLLFMRSIEQNATKMQIARVALTGSETGVTQDITSDAFTIEVYVK